MPRVSCIMPTHDRRRFVPDAIHYFLRQDYDDAELIIVDDGASPVGDVVPPDPRIRYVRLDARRPIGAKRNLACEIASGDLIAHWDDDDWYATDRLRRQVDDLDRSRSSLCGLSTVLYYDPRSGEAWRYEYPRAQRPWLSGNSLMYRRSFWATHRFAEIDVGEDSRFVWSAHPQEVVALSDPPIHVGAIHGGNVSAKQTAGPWWHPLPPDEIRQIIGDDWTRFERPGSGGAADSPAPPTATVAAAPSPIRNIYACLVHERLDCVIDLVRNLRCLDPGSQILLYDGGDPPLLDGSFPFHRFGAVVHAAPRPMRWGKLHEFALDCMRFALDALPFDTITIVDSDQLALRPGFSVQLARCLAGRPGVGMLGNAPVVQPPSTRVPPAITAFQELDLWRPLLRRFPDGERKFVHWTFWPSTVFTAAAAKDLVAFFASDDQLREILEKSQIWATEEVLLPTLVALLGYEVAAGPTSYDFVKYRTPYSIQDAERAMGRADVFWAHPIPRSYQDPFRTRVRSRFGHYQRALGHRCGASPDAAATAGIRLVLPMLERMKRIPGWLDDDEADLLIAVTELALRASPGAQAVVEVGSYLGRATSLLAGVADWMRSLARVHAIDPHDGYVGAVDVKLVPARSSPEMLAANLATAGVAGRVDIHHARAADVAWTEPIALLLIDGLHDYASTARDYFHFEPFLANGAYALFHDYAPYFPGVVAFVDELLAAGGYRKVACVRSMIALRRDDGQDSRHEPD